MNCEKARECILSGANSGKELEAHISSCAGCRDLSSAWSAIKDIRPAATGGPSANIDFKIRGEAAAFLDRRKIQHAVFVRRIFMYAAAACCVLVTWFALVNIDLQTRTQKANSLSSGAIPWSKIDMERDFFELITEIELSIDNIYSDGNGDNGSENDAAPSIPDLFT